MPSPTSRTTLTMAIRKAWKRKWSTRRERWFYVSPNGETVWKLPKRVLQPALAGWSVRWSKTQAPGYAYYVNMRTGESRWQAPSPLAAAICTTTPTTTPTTTTATVHTAYSPSHPGLSF